MDLTIFGIRGTFTGWVDSATGWKNFTTKRLDAKHGTWGYYDPAIFMWYNGIPSTRGWKYIEINFNATMPTSIRFNEDFTNIGYNSAKIDLYFYEHFWQNTITQNPMLIVDGNGYHAPETYDFWNSGNGHANGSYSAIEVGWYAEENYGVRWRGCGITMNETTIQSFSVTPIKIYTDIDNRKYWVVTYDLYFKDSLSGSSLEWNDSSNPRQFLTWIMNYISSYTIDDLPRVNTARFRFTK